MSRHEKTTDGEHAPTTLVCRRIWPDGCAVSPPARCPECKGPDFESVPWEKRQPVGWARAGSVTRPGGYATESAVYDWVKQVVDFAGGTTHWLKVSAGGGADPVGIHADDLVFPLPVKPPSQGDVWTEERRTYVRGGTPAEAAGEEQAVNPPGITRAQVDAAAGMVRLAELDPDHWLWVLEIDPELALSDVVSDIACLLVHALETDRHGEDPKVVALVEALRHATSGVRKP